MGRQYAEITEEEFDEFLDGFASYRKHRPSNSKELVYDIPLPEDNLVVRIWSTIEGGVSRESGTDAIRTVVWDTEVDAPVGGDKKTLRIAPTDSNPKGWKANLKPKIEGLVRNWRRYNRKCPNCGGRMTIRDGEYGNFWGCTNYPECRKTLPLRESEVPSLI